MSGNAEKLEWSKGMLFAVVVGLALMVFMGSRGSPWQGRDYTAFKACRSAITRHSINPSVAMVPRISGVELKDGGMAHVWKMSDGLMLQNGFGRMERLPVSCRTSTKGEVVWLKVGERVVIS